MSTTPCTMCGGGHVPGDGCRWARAQETSSAPRSPTVTVERDLVEGLVLDLRRIGADGSPEGEVGVRRAVLYIADRLERALQEGGRG